MFKIIKVTKKELLSDLSAGFTTGLFSIPEGMAYAKLIGVNPVYGLYSSMVAPIAASLTTGTILMVSTLTSAIAICTGSVILQAGVNVSSNPSALFTITFLVGAIMLVMGLLRLGGVFSGVWLILIVLLLGSLAESVPLR